MNDAKLNFDAGNLKGAIESALNLVKSNPTDDSARIFLFELSCFSGDWERAARQLDVIGHQKVNAMIGSKIYTENFEAERARIDYFAKGTKPEFLMPPPVYVQDLVVANHSLVNGDEAQARELLESVEEKRPAFKCSVNGESFSDFRDYNDLTACVFEVILKGQYMWLPFEQVEKIEFFDRKSLRDVYWMQAQVEMINGTNGEMFLPALYANSWKNADDHVRLGRTVEWLEAGEDVYIGEGIKLFSMNGRDKTILDFKTLEFHHE